MKSILENQKGTQETKGKNDWILQLNNCEQVHNCGTTILHSTSWNLQIKE